MTGACPVMSPPEPIYEFIGLNGLVPVMPPLEQIHDVCIYKESSQV